MFQLWDENGSRDRKIQSEQAAYYQEYRKNVSAEQKLLWSRQSQVRQLHVKNKSIARKATVAKSKNSNRRGDQKREANNAKQQNRTLEFNIRHCQSKYSRAAAAVAAQQGMISKVLPSRYESKTCR